MVKNTNIKIIQPSTKY